ncbi:MAG TPA: adenylate/guanylate cyclase domain-containing protein [Candidatus Methylomirabilis sp.]|nr:adenylate/guanylate cyclase domain-containing protein [Candidatus Methylomirabilis sp.]
MRCPRCQQENSAQAKFCNGCGARLDVSCPRCAQPNPPGSRFCNECGQPIDGAVAQAPPPRFPAPETYIPKHLAEKILTSKGALEGERKQVTVLFADLKGSMELLANQDPEEARNLLDPVLERMMDAVHRYEGTVNQVMGDGIMALFGAPLAHEDHAVRACYAALQMQELVARYADGVFRSHGVTVRIRVGLNSGEVVVRAIGSDLHMDYTAVGQTTHLAARMEQLADPATTLLTPTTLRLAEGYVQVKPRGPVPVKGLAEPVEVYELTGASAVRSRLRAAAGRGLSRFVGRDGEMEQLRRTLEQAGQGRGQVAAIVGEPGVGKSRLVFELTHSHRVAGWLVLEAGSVSYGKATSYLPVIDLLKGYFRIGDRDTYRDIREKLTGKILTLDRALEPTLSALLALLDVPVDDPQWQGLDPPQRRQRTLEALKRLLLRESQLQPLLVVFEDLHWIDSETQALIERLVDSLPTARLLLLVNYRPEYQHGWGGKTYYTQLRLDALPPECAGALLDSLLGPDASVAPLKGLLASRTGGNPLFLEESVNTLVETRTLLGARGAYRLAQPLETIRVPATVQAILAARIDRLPPEEKRLLETAAVIGTTFSFALLEGIADASEEALRRGLGHLQTAEFLYELSLFPDPEYTFKHALTHEVAYGSLLHERRRTLHARIVEAIEQIYPDRPAEQVERLAHHAFRAEMWATAARYLRQAGEKAAARSAYREAVGFFEQSLQALERLPETRESLQAAIDVRLSLGPALMATQSFAAPEVDAVYTTARDLCDRLGDTARLFPVLWGAWMLKSQQRPMEGARDIGEGLLAIARREGDPALLVQAHHALWATLFEISELPGVERHVMEGLAHYTPDLDHAHASRFGGHDPGVCGLRHWGMALWLLGFADRALARMHEGLALAQRLAHAFTSAQILGFAAQLHANRGEWSAARASAEHSLHISTEHGYRQLASGASILLGRCLIEEGRHEEGSNFLTARLAEGLVPGATGRALLARLFLADAYARDGRISEGLQVLADALAIKDMQPYYEPEIHRLQGTLLLQASATRAPEAETHFRHAIHVARRLEARSLELRASTCLARLLQGEGRQDDARHLLAKIYGWFTEGFNTIDLKVAKALLEELT